MDDRFKGYVKRHLPKSESRDKLEKEQKGSDEEDNESEEKEDEEEK